MAKPWLKKVPRATPNNIFFVLFLAEKDKTKSCVLSPNSEKNTSVKVIKKG